jgi:hypothetical protein
LVALVATTVSGFAFMAWWGTTDLGDQELLDASESAPLLGDGPYRYPSPMMMMSGGKTHAQPSDARVAAGGAYEAVVR